MPRRASVRYWPTRKGYCCKIRGQQHLLASGPDDYADGPTFKAACRAFWELTEGTTLDGGDRSAVRAVLDAYLTEAQTRLQTKTFPLQLCFCRLFADRWGDLACGRLAPHHPTSVITEMR